MARGSGSPRRRCEVVDRVRVVWDERAHACESFRARDVRRSDIAGVLYDVVRAWSVDVEAQATPASAKPITPFWD